jgi:hypothetical protein
VTARPWRGYAYYPCGNGARLVMRKVAAKTREGLADAEARAAEAGMEFDCWEVLPLPGVTRGTQVADSPTG